MCVLQRWKLRYDWQYFRAASILDPRTVLTKKDRNDWMGMVQTVVDTVPVLSRLPQGKRSEILLQARRVHMVRASSTHLQFHSTQ